MGVLMYLPNFKVIKPLQEVLSFLISLFFSGLPYVSLATSTIAKESGTEEFRMFSIQT